MRWAEETMLGSLVFHVDLPEMTTSRTSFALQLLLELKGLESDFEAYS